MTCLTFFGMMPTKTGIHPQKHLNAIWRPTLPLLSEKDQNVVDKALDTIETEFESENAVTDVLVTPDYSLTLENSCPCKVDYTSENQHWVTPGKLTWCKTLGVVHKVRLDASIEYAQHG